MIVLDVINVHDALPRAVKLLTQRGTTRQSRNGPVVLLQEPVSTVYVYPYQKVMFWPDRDANPFFHLYEGLWMLRGRNDVAPLVRYVKRSTEYSDNGVTLHGAYGYRWRGWFKIDQLAVIAKRLKENPDDRRCVLQMWDTYADLGRNGKDVPCNTMATFQRGVNGELNLSVFCRSNDIVWGAYGANAVQFGFLLEYMALWIGCPVGTYTQISVNWHGYVDTLAKVAHIQPDAQGFVYNPYFDNGRVRPQQMFHGTIDVANKAIGDLLFMADNGFAMELDRDDSEPFFDTAYHMLKAHHLWKSTKGPERYGLALEELGKADPLADWIVAGREWILRRELKSADPV